MQQSTKMRAILVAGAALVAAGAFATALGEETANGGTAPIVLVGKMTLGGTATTTTPPTAVPNAAPRPEGDCALRIQQGLLITSVYGVGRGTASGNPCGWANQ